MDFVFDIKVTCQNFFILCFAKSGNWQMSKFLYWVKYGFFLYYKSHLSKFLILSRVNSGNWQTLKFPYFAIRKIWHCLYYKFQASKSLYLASCQTWKLFNWIAVYWLSFERSLPPVKLGQTCLKLLKLMTSKVTQGRRIRKAGYGRLGLGLD